MDYEADIEEKGGKKLVFRIVQGVLAVLLVIAFVYSSGLYYRFFYQRTPASVQQESIEASIDAESISVQLSVYVLRNEESNGSKRSRENIFQLVENASAIWAQSSIALKIQTISELERTDKEIDTLLSAPRVFVQNSVEFTPDTIDVFLVENLRGINGIAFGGLNAVAVADYTSVYDFRALAHEIGHILGLDHVPGDRGRLMFQGANGSLLSADEILYARESALRLIL